eukprot:COSAG05_NODE_7_length_42457_cov_58.929152_13_plen_92_part_00
MLAPPNTFVMDIKAIRDRTKWWSRGLRYQDTMGVGNPYAGRLDVRRFDDTANRTILAIDNYQNLTGLTVTFAGRSYLVEPAQLSVIDVGSY